MSNLFSGRPCHNEFGTKMGFSFEIKEMIHILILI